jgi:hypothetical protein
MQNNPRHPNTPASVGGFLAAIKAWAQHLEEDGADRAAPDSETARIFGQLLAENPEFEDIFHRHLGNCCTEDPEEALKCVYAFLNAVAETTRPGNFRSQRWRW